jgi:hypothetical protein
MTTYEEKQEVLQALYEKVGHLTTSIVLAEAKKVRSPIHDLFEWDDSSAANQYRLDQARHLIRSVKITFKGSTEALFNVPSISLEDGPEGFYQIPSVIVKTQSHFDHALGKLKAMVNSAQHSLDELLSAKKGLKKHLTEARKGLKKAKRSLDAANADL